LPAPAVAQVPDLSPLLDDLPDLSKLPAATLAPAPAVGSGSALRSAVQPMRSADSGDGWRRMLGSVPLGIVAGTLLGLVLGILGCAGSSLATPERYVKARERGRASTSQFRPGLGTLVADILPINAFSAVGRNRDLSSGAHLGLIADDRAAVAGMACAQVLCFLIAFVAGNVVVFIQRKRLLNRR